MNYYLPKNLNLLDVFYSHDIEDEVVHLDKYYYVISLLSSSYSQIMNDKQGWIRLKAVYLQNVIGKHNNRILNNLERIGIIEINHKYYVGKQAKGYRLTKEYQNTGFQTLPMLEKIENKYIRFRDNDLDIEDFYIKERANDLFSNQIEINNYDSIYHDLKNVVNNVTIDLPRVQQLIHTNKLSDKAFITADKINNKDFYFIIGKQTNRIYSNITSLKKELRKCLYLNDEPVIEFDIANSQPLLFTALIPDDFRNEPDVKHYIELVESGKLYEYLITEYTRKYKLTKIRDDFKKMTFAHVFYCKVSGNYRYKVSKLFREIFPTVFRVIVGYKKEDYKALAVKLQKSEVEIIIKRVCKDLLSQSIPVITIHDCIMVNEKYSKEAKETMIKIFNQQGIYPTIR